MPEEFALDMVRRDLDRPHDYEVIYGPNYREHTLRSLARQLDEMADSQNEHMAALVGLSPYTTTAQRPPASGSPRPTSGHRPLTPRRR